jgi:serine/threonine protein kinase
VAGRYRLKKLLGTGSYGKVYSAQDQGQGQADHKDVAIKISKHSLRHELVIYSFLNTYAFCPKLHASGVAGKFHYLVFEQCGPSIEGTYTLDVVLRIGLLLLQMLRDLHAVGIVHGDLKPSNILWRSTRQGQGEGPALQGPAPLVLIDYGLAQVMDRIASPAPDPDPVVFQGNYKFASLRQHEHTYNEHTHNEHTYNEHTHNEHTCNEHTCAVDDVESLGYLLIYLLGYLPWLGTDAPSEIAHKKLNVHLYTVIPGEFITWLQYCQRLSPEQRPNYVYLRNLVGNLYVREQQLIRQKDLKSEM